MQWNSPFWFLYRFKHAFKQQHKKATCWLSLEMFILYVWVIVSLWLSLWFQLLFLHVRSKLVSTVCRRTIFTSSTIYCWSNESMEDLGFSGFLSPRYWGARRYHPSSLWRHHCNFGAKQHEILKWQLHAIGRTLSFKNWNCALQNVSVKKPVPLKEYLWSGCLHFDWLYCIFSENHVNHELLKWRMMSLVEVSGGKQFPVVHISRNGSICLV